MILGGISSHDAQAFAIGAGIIAASITAVIVLFRQPVISTPIRWFGRVVISDPLTTVIHQALDLWAKTPDGPVDRIDKRLSSLEEQNTRNNGSTTRDRINAVGRAVGADPDPVAHP